MIEWTTLAKDGQMQVFRSNGYVPFKSTGEGKRIQCSFKNNQLQFEGEDSTNMSFTWQSAISEAISRDPLIGMVWLVKVTLFAALDADAKTQKLRTVHCKWEEASARAQKKQSKITSGANNTSDHCGKSTEAERNNITISGGGSGHHLIENYQETLSRLQNLGDKHLKQAKQKKQ
ncbi:hypothetical protein N7539_008676 [Penicillium diatomitis]|uniref:Uncharacterized protein n=1 Tax=Penicillium diatomitis TaxID=2819901 RepID=A0A9W9WR13_9EURO|nr:uncharacterized protein N7539_008676 [Penicillium diatomitis]KAJ5472107.1 hypothetical protein N7539_008676 [Penicillium diatomitis]